MSEIDSKSFYSGILAECILILDRVNQNEQDQIGLALEIGKMIDQLVTHTTDGQAIIKKLARDIARARGKIILPSKLYEYQQLYLNFGSIETIRSVAERSLNDISTDMLLKLAGKSKEAGAEDKTNNEDLISILNKVLKFLTRFETTIEDRELSAKELAEVAKSIESIQDKTRSILTVVQSYGGRYQMDLFAFSTDDAKMGMPEASELEAIGEFRLEH